MSSIGVSSRAVSPFALLGVLTLSLVLLGFLPHLFWWQQYLPIFAILLMHLLVLFALINQRARKTVIIVGLEIVCLAWFYSRIWSQPSTESSCSVALPIVQGEGLQVVNHSAIAKQIIDSSSRHLSLVESSVDSLEQKEGEVLILQFKDEEDKKFSVAFVSPVIVNSTSRWYDVRILLRRLGSILRHRQDPVLVVISGAIAAPGSLLSSFMFQARLESGKSLAPFRSLYGLPSTIAVERDVKICGLDHEVNLWRFEPTPHSTR